VNICEAPRPRNRRGEGSKLRADIVAAATAILDETGNEDAVTLRAVARRVGISAPSIYAHFPDREAILVAVLEQAFEDLIDALTEAIDTETDPVARLRAGCGAYLNFAERRPERYRVLFQRGPTGERSSSPGEKPPAGLDAFNILVGGIQACADAGRSTSTDAFADATAVWVALHGYALLRAELPTFPWPPSEQVFDRIALQLAGVTS
jgi:AcrR family transcriptional regulator